MKKLLCKNGYLIYFGISAIVFSRYGIFSIRFWIALVILFLLVKMAKGFWGKGIKIRTFRELFKKFGWCLGLCFFSSCFVPIISIRWWIINISTFCLILCRLIIIERN